MKKITLLLCILVVSCSTSKCRLSVQYVGDDNVDLKKLSGYDFMPGVKCEF